MRTLLLIPLLALVSCGQNKKPVATSDISTLDASELLNPDDNFKAKKPGKSRVKDSFETYVQYFSDLNNDGIRDTATILFNKISLKNSVMFSCFSHTIQEKSSSPIALQDIGDLNDDGRHELMVVLQSDEGCWDEIKLYSYIDNWVEKYNGLTYQCTENRNYEFRQLDDKSIQLTTYGVNKDSVDLTNGDTLENVIPNAHNTHIITW